MPPNISHQVISFYNSIMLPDDQATMTMGDWLSGTRAGRWHDIVEPARTEYQHHGKTSRYSALKLQLPAVTPAGTFAYRCIGGLAQPSGILHADVDELSERRLQWANKSLQDDPHVVYVFLSPSAAGLKFGVAIPSVDADGAYKHLFYGLHQHCRRAHGILIDKACADICRLCFVSVDPQLYVNPAPALFNQTANTVPHSSATQARSNPFQFRFSPPKRMPTPTITATAQALFDRAERRLETAPQGARHRSRLSVGALIGGLIQGGMLCQAAAEAIIETAKTYSAHPAQAERTMRDALRFGAAYPITPEHRMLNRTRRRTYANNRGVISWQK